MLSERGLVVTGSAGAGWDRPAPTPAEGEGAKVPNDGVLPKTCPECRAPFSAPRLQTLQKMHQAPVRRLRFECGACGHAISRPVP